MRNAGAKMASIAVSVCFIAACGTALAATATQVVVPSATPSPEGIWENLLLATPYPHQFPLQAETAIPLDGTFAKIDPSPPQW